MVTGDIPFLWENVQTLLCMVGTQSAEIKWPDDTELDDDFRDIIKSCLRFVPEERLTARAILGHRFFEPDCPRSAVVDPLVAQISALKARVRFDEADEYSSSSQLEYECTSQSPNPLQRFDDDKTVLFWSVVDPLIAIRSALEARSFDDDEYSSSSQLDYEHTPQSP